MTHLDEEAKTEKKPIGVSSELRRKFEEAADKLIAERKVTKPPQNYT
jgi:hypothetical protein